jgi:hypothetical protein
MDDQQWKSKKHKIFGTVPKENGKNIIAIKKFCYGFKRRIYAFDKKNKKNDPYE